MVQVTNCTDDMRSNCHCDGLTTTGQVVHCSHCLGLKFKLVYKQYRIVMLLQCLHINEIKISMFVEERSVVQLMDKYVIFSCVNIFPTAVISVCRFYSLSPELPRKDS